MSEDTSDEHTSNGSDGEEAADEELEGMMSSIRKAERRQKVRAALYAVAVIVLAIVAVYAFFTYRDELFVPKVDMDEAGKMAWEKTNDPECRALIDQVTTIGEDYYEYEDVVDTHLLGDDPDKIKEIKRRMESFKTRLNKAEELSGQAELRYEDSARQLDEWFDYVDMEIGFVERLADERLAQLEREAAESAASSDAGDDAARSAGDGADAGGVLVHSADAGDQKEDKTSDKTPEERRDGALVALDGAFQNFRVWHSANAHPCGAAADDEEPWRPEEGAGSKSASSKEAPAE